MMTYMTTFSAARASEPAADETIGHNVHEIIWSRKIVQRDFAAALRISDSVLSKRLRGTSAWSAQDIADAAVLLDVEPGRLFRPITDPYLPPYLAASTDNPDRTAPRARMLSAVK